MGGLNLNANNILYSFAIHIQNITFTRSLCKKLLMIKSVKCVFLHLVQRFLTGCVLRCMAVVWGSLYSRLPGIPAGFLWVGQA